jgi:beta-galactosidase
MMKSFLPIFLLTLATQIHAQSVQYNQPFAPTAPRLHPSEEPYRQSICLNGLWQFQPVSLPASFKEGIDSTPTLPADNNRYSPTPIRIPSPWNVNSFADKQGQGGDFRTYPSYPKEWESIKMGWLRKTFAIPASWKGRRIRLCFDAVAGDAQILVNGKTAGHHFGIFLPFAIDVTDLIRFGETNDLRIGIRKPSLFDRRGAYGRRPYQAGSFWGQHIAGIWQDVNIEAIPPVSVSTVYIRPLVDSDKLEADVTITNESDQAQTLSIGGDIYRWIPAQLPLPSSNLENKPSLTLPSTIVTIPAHSSTVQTLTIAIHNHLQLWTPDSPTLYGFITRLKTDHSQTTTHSQNTIIDTKYTRFGWRQTKLKDGKFLLNNQPLVLKGDSWHFLGIPQMTRRYAWAWYTAMRDAHLNAVRLHAQPYPSFYLDMADEMGILVLDETAVWASDGGPKLDEPAFWADTRQQLQEQICRDRNHPSVFGWSVSNEVKPVIRNVMHGPAAMMDTLLANFSSWASICRTLDPTRPWISADGEDDGDGRLPVYIVHYGGTESMDRARKSGKPWGVGEAGNAYYGTPQQVAETNGARAYASFLGRMEGVAISSWSSLMAQRSRGAIYRSVFNLVWYGLQPLTLGMKDTTQPPSLTDGIFFPAFKEGQPGVQPERLGPYCTTLNPGYDPKLPLYKTWPLFDAIKDASGPTPSAQAPIAINPPLSSPLIQSPTPPAFLLIDASNPLPANTITQIAQTLKKGGNVLILGINPEQLSTINQFLPEPLTLTNRVSSSLEGVTLNASTKGLTAADLYFSEQKPPGIMTHGLDGPLLKKSTILLQASNTDWLKWNKQPEYAKTAMVIRSERETHPSGAALISITTGGGTLFLSTLPANPHLEKEEKFIHHLLINLGADTTAANTGAVLQTNDGVLTPDLRHLKASDSAGQAWLDFYISSPRSLDDLLSEPDIPTINLQLLSTEVREVYLNDHPLTPIPNQQNHLTIPTLRLQQGWNHFHILLRQTADGWSFTARLISNHPEFLRTLTASMEKP